MPTPNRRTTAPKAKVSLDLDKLEREGERPEPFTVRLKGKVFTFADPDDMDYFELTSLSMSPEGERRMLQTLLGDQYDDFVASGPVPPWKIIELFETWRDHYGMLDPGEAPASVGSSNGTAAR